MHERASPRSAPLAWWLSLASLCAACEGTAYLEAFAPTLEPAPAETSPGSPSPSAPETTTDSLGRTRFTCAPEAVPGSLPLRRLSRAQYMNNVKELVARALPDEPTALAALTSSLEQLPPDTKVGATGERRGGFSVVDQSLQQAFAEASYELAVQVGRELTRTAARLRKLLGACATDDSASNDAACLDKFLRSFGARVYRRPLDEAEVGALVSAAGGTPVAAAAVADVVGLLFASPPMVFFLEHGTEPSSDRPALSGYELASRLSFHFWRAPPDDALWAAAASGELLTAAGLAAQVDRLAADARAADAYEEFFSEWFALEELPELDGAASLPKFIAFAGADLPNANTREAAIRDVQAMSRWTVANGGSLSDLLQERRSFTPDALLARLYDAPLWDGAAAPPEPRSPRAGLLTRVAFLASGGADTRPILKGARLRNSLMCEVIQLPPGNVAAVAPAPATNTTTRGVVQALTEKSPACAGCHLATINPLGFTTEGFDALGRARTEEALYDDAGRKLLSLPVDTRTRPYLRGASDTAEADGPEALTRLLDESGRVQSCFARQYFRFTQAREETAEDGCALADLETASLEGRPLTDVFKLPALRPDFLRRSFR